MGQGAGAPVVVYNGKGGAGHRVGAAKARGQALGESGFARAEAPGEAHQRAGRQRGREPAAQGHRFGPAVGDENRHGHGTSFFI